MNIIFLDIDGVLNTDRWEEYMLEHGLPLEDEFGIYFDENSVENLKAVIKATEADIVVHSTWKLGKTLGWVQSLWAKRKLPGNVRSITPDISPRYDKTDEIDAWLSSHPGVRNYVILDDEEEFSPSQLQHLVKVDSTCGISARNINEAVAILSRV